MRARVFHNSRSGRPGSGGGAQALAGALAAAGVEAQLVALDDATLEKLVRSAAADGFDAVVAAGGDGTVSAVAGIIATHGLTIPFGVLPVGTLNHFAKDMGLPLTLDAASTVIAAGQTRAVDVGEVNGRSFVNNSSIGLYPHMVSKRDRHQQRLGYGKWLAMFVAFLSIFRRYPLLRVVVDTGDATFKRTTPFVFIGNNRYGVALFNLGGRDCMDKGELSLYTANRTGRLGLLRLALRALIGRLDQAKDFDAVCLPSFTIDTRKKTLRVALDGEVTRMTPPLRYRTHPAALHVLVAPPVASAEDAAEDAALNRTGPSVR